MDLEEAICEFFRRTMVDVYRNNSEIFPVISASISCLATRAYIKARIDKPATFFIAIVGKQRTGKSTLIREISAILTGGGIFQIPTGTPEALVEAISEIRHGFLAWDEADEILKKSRSYLDTIPHILNKMYYCDAISMKRRKSRSVSIPADSYFMNVYLGAHPDEWAQMCQTFIAGFERRFLVIRLRGYIPYFHFGEPDEKAPIILGKIHRALDILKEVQVFAEIEGLEELEDKLCRENLDDDKKSAIEEYIPKIILGRMVAKSVDIDIKDRTEFLEKFLNNMERQGVRIEVSNDNTSLRDFGELRPLVEYLVILSSGSEGVI